MNRSLLSLIITGAIMSAFMVMSDVSGMIAGQIMEGGYFAEQKPALTSIRATRQDDGTILLDFTADNTRTYSLMGDIESPVEDAPYDGLLAPLRLKNADAVNAITLVLANRSLEQAILLSFGEDEAALLQAEMIKGTAGVPDEALAIAQNPLAFNVDALNSFEVPAESDVAMEMQVGRDEETVVFGSLAHPLRKSDVIILATVASTATEEVWEVSTTVRTGESGLFSLPLPRLSTGTYIVEVQSTDGIRPGPVQTITLELTRLLEATVPQIVPRQVNWPLVSFMGFVIVISAYAFFFHRPRKPAQS